MSFRAQIFWCTKTCITFLLSCFKVGELQKGKRVKQIWALTPSQCTSDRVIRRITAAVIPLIEESPQRGAVKNKCCRDPSPSPTCLICLSLMQRQKVRTVKRKRRQDWGRPPPSQGQTRGVNTWCLTLHINSAELITLIKQTHILSELRWPIAAS